MRLAGKIISGFLLVSLLPIVLISALLYIYIQSNMESVLRQRSELAVRAFHHFLEEREKALESAANDLTGDKEFLITLLDPEHRGDNLTSMIQKKIGERQFQFGIVRLEGSGMQWGVTAGHAVQSASTALPLPFAEKGKLTGLSRITLNRSDEYALVTMTPIVYRGKIEAQLLLGWSLAGLVREFPRSLYGVAALLTETGDRVVAVEAEKSVLDALKQRTASDSIDSEVSGKEYFIRESGLQALDGATLATAHFLFDLEEFRQSRSRLVRTLSMLTVGAILLSLLVGWFYARFISRPVLEMSEAARQIAKGEMPERVHYFYDDEIGDLVAGMNRLTDDLKETERRLKLSEQIAAWQLFARQTAHEIRNFLMPLSATVGGLQRQAEEGKIGRRELQDAVQNIQLEIARMKQLLGAFSEFAKLPLPQIKSFLTAELMADVKAAFPRESEEGRLHFDISIDQLSGDRGQLGQVLVNLVKNSFEAQATIVEVNAAENDGRIQFRVIDDGSGVAKGADPFQPLYSTKELGAGLGLAVVKRIVVDHGGDIKQFPGPTGGTVFEFDIPTRR